MKVFWKKSQAKNRIARFFLSFLLCNEPLSSLLNTKPQIIVFK